MLHSFDSKIVYFIIINVYLGTSSIVTRNIPFQSIPSLTTKRWSFRV